MKHSIIHTFIIWSKGRKKAEFILTDLQKEFEILKIFRGYWKPEMFLRNNMIFYAHSQYRLEPDDYHSLLQGKVLHGGYDDFTIVILRDNNPTFASQRALSGEKIVNKHLFDKKIQYRELTGGGHKIHASDNEWETNQDLTLLFGLNTKDFCSHYNLDGQNEIFSQNCQGVEGYDSYEKFFYVLNNTTRYVILYTDINTGDKEEKQCEVELLCDNVNWMAYLTAARHVATGGDKTYLIKIGDKDIRFHFRQPGDNYFDLRWQENILKNRVLSKNSYYCPDSENRYYTLLYHALIQNTEFSEGHKNWLSQNAGALGSAFYPEIKDAIKQLDKFMLAHHYEYSLSKDTTVIYNKDNIAMSDYALRIGRFIKRIRPLPTDDKKFNCCVYEKEDSFVKVGTSWLIDNEARYLEQMSRYRCVPQLLRKERATNNNEKIIEISKVEGDDFETFFNKPEHHTWKYLRSFILECLNLLSILADENIAHRDFTPANLIIRAKDGKCEVSLIDFGWATEFNKMYSYRPQDGTGWYISSENATDAFSFGRLLAYYWYDLAYVKLISHILCSGTTEDASSSDQLKSKYDRATFYAKYFFWPFDWLGLYDRRHLNVDNWIRHMRISYHS